MRIAILNWRDLAHSDAGGAEVFVHEVGRRWATMGHPVSLFSSRTNYLSARDSNDGMLIERVGKVGNGSHHLQAPRTIGRSRKFDVILESINTIPYFMPVRPGKTPHVSLVHQMALDVWEAHLAQPLAFLAARAEPLMYRCYAKRSLLAVSESTKADLAAAGLDNVSVIPQGGIGRQARLPEKEAVPTLLFVGRLSANKRPDHAVEAFRLVKAHLPQARLWIVGEGEMRRTLSKELPHDAELLGRLPRDELLDRMGRAHLLLVTSIREGWGLVVTEANAMGTPAVTYDVPGLRDSVRHAQTGLRTHQTPSSLASSCIELLSAKRYYRRLRAGAIDWGAEHSWDAPARVLLETLGFATLSVGAGSDRASQANLSGIR